MMIECGSGRNMWCCFDSKILQSAVKFSDQILLSHVQRSCILHFDGATKGICELCFEILKEPWLFGCLVVQTTTWESIQICRNRQGLGVATCNAAEYHAVISRLKKALEKGYTSIQALDDSKLVCMQVTFWILYVILASFPVFTEVFILLPFCIEEYSCLILEANLMQGHYSYWVWEVSKS